MTSSGWGGLGGWEGGCLPEGVGDRLKPSIPNLFPREQSYRITHPPARVNKKPFLCPWLCLPPSLYSCFPCESICKWYHLSAYCHLPPAHPFIKCLQLVAGLPCPPCSIVPLDPGEGVCVWAGEGGRVPPTAPAAGPGGTGGAAGKTQLHGETDSSPSPSGIDRWPCRDSSPGPPHRH